MKFAALKRLERNVHRAGEIIAVLAKYGLADWVKGLDYPWIQDRIQSCDGQRIPDLKIGERMRLAFTELGTTFIKLGQVLGTRPDLVGLEVARELAHLQIAAPADPFETVRATIEADLGNPLNKTLANFQHAPMASASIAITRCILGGISTSFISTISTVVPQGAERSLRLAFRMPLILSRSLSTSSISCWPMILRRPVNATW